MSFENFWDWLRFCLSIKMSQLKFLTSNISYMFKKRKKINTKHSTNYVLVLLNLPLEKIGPQLAKIFDEILLDYKINFNLNFTSNMIFFKLNQQHHYSTECRVDIWDNCFSKSIEKKRENLKRTCLKIRIAFCSHEIM